MKIQYSPEAIDDLIRLREFIQVKNPHAAKRVASNILSGIERLQLFPKIGLPVERAETGNIRDLFVTNYTVRYLVDQDSIYILRIWHNKESGKDV